MMEIFCRCAGGDATLCCLATMHTVGDAEVGEEHGFKGINLEEGLAGKRQESLAPCAFKRVKPERICWVREDGETM
jgi:hypothetical protein